MAAAVKWAVSLYRHTLTAPKERVERNRKRNRKNTADKEEIFISYI